MDDPVAVHNREFTGVESLMWGNDWPHQEGSHPWSAEATAKQFAGVPDDEVRKIVHDNGAQVFGLTV
jgi:predicted TIM-barrel fold metal-dependent hydrolase